MCFCVFLLKSVYKKVVCKIDLAMKSPLCSYLILCVCRYHCSIYKLFLKAFSLVVAIVLATCMEKSYDSLQ